MCTPPKLPYRFLASDPLISLPIDGCWLFAVVATSCRVAALTAIKSCRKNGGTCHLCITRISGSNPQSLPVGVMPRTTTKRFCLEPLLLHRLEHQRGGDIGASRHRCVAKNPYSRNFLHFPKVWRRGSSTCTRSPCLRLLPAPPPAASTRTPSCLHAVALRTSLTGFPGQRAWSPDVCPFALKKARAALGNLGPPHPVLVERGSGCADR